MKPMLAAEDLRRNIAQYLTTTFAIVDATREELAAFSTVCRSKSHHRHRLADESLHLTSAFRLARFRYVIASLWPIGDRFFAAASSIYQHLSAIPTADHAAAVLHRVTRELRNDYPKRPDLWVA